MDLGCYAPVDLGCYAPVNRRQLVRQHGRSDLGDQDQADHLLQFRRLSPRKTHSHSSIRKAETLHICCSWILFLNTSLHNFKPCMCLGGSRTKYSSEALQDNACFSTSTSYQEIQSTYRFEVLTDLQTQHKTGSPNRLRLSSITY